MRIFKNRQNIYKSKQLQNKAQVSFFVIAGLVIFVAVIAGFFVYNKIRASKIEEEAKKVSDLSLQAEEIERFVSDCIRKTAFDGLIKLGQTGGYFDVPKLISFKGVAMWHLDQVNIQPFLNQTQERLIEHINTNVPKCVENENITKFGFLIEKKEPTIFIEFGTADVTIKVSYPIKVSKEDFTKEFSGFFNTFDIRYRAVFEAATELNERTFDADFDIKEPLKKMNYLKNLEFDVSYKALESDILTFTITDKKSITPTNELYTFKFATKLGKSELKRLTDLQNKSSSNPAVLPYTIFSVDKKAQLDISSGTTISKDGQDVQFISVQQSYLSEAVTKDVPVHKRNKDVVQKQDITYVIDNPVYSFEPTGVLFNQFQKLTLYYDPATDDSKGMGILMGKNGFWIPITSKHEPENKKVFSNILGFTEFTAVSCATQKAKETIAEHLFEPNAGCYISLAIMIIAIALIIFVAFVAISGAFVATTGASVLPGTIIPASAVGVGTATVPLTTVQAIGFALTGGLVTSAATAGLIGVAFATISLASTILGATTDVFYGKSPDNCETFYPTCDQIIDIEKGGDAKEGQCIPDKGQRVAAGAPVNICAQVEKCGGFIEKTICKSCSQKCTAKFY